MSATAWRDIRFPTCTFTCRRWGDRDGAGVRIIHSAELNPGVLWLWSGEWRAPLSSLQSSLNLANRICYRCNGRNKGSEAGIRRGFLEEAGCALKKLVCVCVLCVLAIFPWQKNPELPQHICLFPPQAENASPTPLCFSPVFCWALRDVLYALILVFSCRTCNNILWITDQLELVFVLQRWRENNTVSDVWPPRDGSSNIIGLIKQCSLMKTDGS